jgi:dethiobiotin synthetase
MRLWETGYDQSQAIFTNWLYQTQEQELEPKIKAKIEGKMQDLEKMEQQLKKMEQQLKIK